MQGLPRSAQLYLAGLWALALAVAGGGLRLLWAPLSLPELLAALIFAVLLTVADLTAFEMDDGRIVSIAVAVLIGALTSLAWPALLAAIMLGTICGALARNREWWNVLSTIAVRWLAAATGVALATLHVGTWTVDAGGDAIPYTSLPSLGALLLTGAVFYLVERGAVALLAWLSSGTPLSVGLRPHRDEL
ncbi:MAG: hypothetical protein SNJ69_15980, partial [Chloroflexaceae bacterium]